VFVVFVQRIDILLAFCWDTLWTTVLGFAIAIAGGVMLGVFAGSERTQFWALFVACACVVALVLLWTTKLTLGYRRPDEAEAR